jgi:hypothetical protein
MVATTIDGRAAEAALPPLTPLTIRDAVRLIGFSPRDNEDMVFTRITGGKAVNYLYPEIEDDEVGADIYIAGGYFRPGTITPSGGRKGENVSSVSTLAVDCDLKGFLRISKEELRDMPESQVEDKLDLLRDEVLDVSDALQLPPTRLVCSGFGFWLWYDIAHQDQQRHSELQKLYKRLVAAFNEQAGFALADKQVSDAGSRLARLPGSWNTKGKTPRQSRIIHEDGNSWTVDALRTRLDRVAEQGTPSAQPPPPEESLVQGFQAKLYYPGGTGPLSSEGERELIDLVGRHWLGGHRHELAVGLSGMFHKAGMPQDQAERIIYALAADDEERDSRIVDVETTYERPACDNVGWMWVKDALPDSTMQQVGAILDALYAQNNPPKLLEIDGPLLGQPEPLPPAPEFPIHALPPAIRDYVEASARSINVPVEMVAVPIIAVAGALMGNRYHLALKTDYCAYPSLWAAIVAPPGSGKTPALNAASRPLKMMQRMAMNEHQKRVNDHIAEMDKWKNTERKMRGVRPEPPEGLHHYLTTNITIESLAVTLASPGVVYLKDEISGWIKDMDKYSGGKGGEKEQYMGIWSFEDLKVDRKSNGGTSLSISKPVLGVVGGIQPDIAHVLNEQGELRDGFVERFLPIVPDLGPQQWTTAAATKDQFMAVLDLFELLDNPTFDIPNGDDNMGFKGVPITLHPDANRAWVEWIDDNSRRVFETGGIRGGFYSKLGAYTPRIALILHGMWNPADPRPMITLERMQHAITVAEFFRDHMHRLIPLLQRKATTPRQSTRTRMASADHIARCLERRETENPDDEGWLDRSAILVTTCIPAPTLTAELEALEIAGVIERRVIEGKGRTKSTEQWRLTTVPTEDATPTTFSTKGHSNHSNHSNFKVPTGAYGTTTPILPRSDLNSLNSLSGLNGGAKEKHAGQPMAS